jgi:hypothetical protein
MAIKPISATITPSPKLEHRALERIDPCYLQHAALEKLETLIRRTEAP